MKSIFILFSMATSVVSRAHDDVTLQEETTDLKFYGNSKIGTSENSEFFVAAIESGDKLVFKYKFNREADPKIPDSGYRETIIFEIEPNETKFSLLDDELQTIQPFYRQFCFCRNTESVKITNGKISGTKISATKWNIYIDVDIVFKQGQNPVNKQISGNFILD